MTTREAIENARSNAVNANNTVQALKRQVEQLEYGLSTAMDFIKAQESQLVEQHRRIAALETLLGH